MAYLSGQEPQQGDRVTDSAFGTCVVIKVYESEEYDTLSQKPTDCSVDIANINTGEFFGDAVPEHLTLVKRTDGRKWI